MLVNAKEMLKKSRPEKFFSTCLKVFIIKIYFIVLS